MTFKTLDDKAITGSQWRDLAFRQAIYALAYQSRRRQLLISGDMFRALPLGVLLMGAGDDGVHFTYVVTEAGHPIKDQAEMAVAILTHNAGGCLHIRDSDVSKMPDGRVVATEIDGGDGIAFQWQPARDPQSAQSLIPWAS